MKAFISDRYGSPDVMRLGDVEKPRITTDEQVLVRVRATSVNAHDWHMLRGKPYLARLSAGLRRPKSTIRGLDVAGIVEETGAGITHLNPGDEVFGSRMGAFAEYVVGKNFVAKPGNLTLEQAAAVPTAGLTALQAVRDHAAVQPGQRILVNGAGGGVGSFAVQIAKAFGAEVTAVTSERNVEVARTIGADHVVDYGQHDFTRGRERYDAILDAGGNHSLRRLRRALGPDGTIVLIAPAPGDWIAPIVRMVGARVTSRIGSHQVRGFLATVNRDDLLVLRGLAEAGKLTPVIDRTFPFDQIPDAVRHIESGQAGGKVVITV